MPVSIVFINMENTDEARRIGRILVEERLAAAVNITGEISSYFLWDGAVREATEAQIVAKTRTDRIDALTARVRELHGYVCPCILAVPASGGNPDYIAWVEREARGA